MVYLGPAAVILVGFLASMGGLLGVYGLHRILRGGTPSRR